MPTSLLVGQGALVYAWPHISAAWCLLCAWSPGRTLHWAHHTDEPWQINLLPQYCHSAHWAGMTVKFSPSPSLVYVSTSAWKTHQRAKLLQSCTGIQYCVLQHSDIKDACGALAESHCVQKVQSYACVSVLPWGIISQWLLFPGLCSTLHMI